MLTTLISDFAAILPGLVKVIADVLPYVASLSA